MRFYLKINNLFFVLFFALLLVSAVAIYLLWDVVFIYIALIIFFADILVFMPLAMPYLIMFEDHIKIKKGVFFSKKLMYENIKDVQCNETAVQLEYNDTQIKLELKQTEDLCEEIRKRIQ